MIISSIHFDDILHTVLCLTAAILKDSDFNEIDRAECQFTTTATVLDNGTQVWFAYTLVLKFLDISFNLYASNKRYFAHDHENIFKETNLAYFVFQ